MQRPDHAVTVPNHGLQHHQKSNVNMENVDGSCRIIFGRKVPMNTSVSYQVDDGMLVYTYWYLPLIISFYQKTTTTKNGQRLLRKNQKSTPINQMIFRPTLTFPLLDTLSPEEISNIHSCCEYFSSKSWQNLGKSHFQNSCVASSMQTPQFPISNGFQSFRYAI